MCGINGFNWQDEKLAKKMNEAIKHRGPDDKGVYSDKDVTLGQVRLAIIDLTKAGFQPMHYSKKIGASNAKFNKVHINKKELSIVFNGEIYNYQELRKELEQKNYFFSTKSDTEVILASYLEWGRDCVQKFNGMWAFCIYDQKKKELFLSRDRLGQKPIYYYLDEEKNKFVFGSEIKTILQDKKIDKTIDKEAIDLYLSLGFIPSPYSIYKKIRKLGAGENLIYNLKTNKIEIKSYYKKPTYKPINDEKTLIKEGRELLKDSVRLRLIADVPVGAFLSGGLDSSAVVGEMAEFVDLKKLHTFSVGFKEKGRYDETKYINIVKNYFKTKHHHHYFEKKEFEKLLKKIFYHYDEPFGDYSCFPTYSVSELARKDVTISLSGDGGDEIFGGYTMHQVGAQMNFIRKTPKILRKIGLTIMSPLKINNPLNKINQLKEALRMSLLPAEKFYSEAASDQVYKPEIYKKWTETKLKEALKISNNNFTEAMIKNDLFNYTLADYFLVKVDRASMANSLEVRSPFLDYRFVEFSAKIPVKWKCDIRKRKKLMRKIIKGLVPNEIVTRGKQGFEPPLDKWIKEDKYMKEVEEAIPKLYKQGILSKEWKEFFEQKVLKGNNNQLYQVYKIKLFLLNRWMGEWIN